MLWLSRDWKSPPKRLFITWMAYQSGVLRGRARIVPRRPRAAGRPARERLLHRGLHHGRLDVAGHGDHRAPGLEVRLRERHDVVARDGLHRILRHPPPIQMLLPL